MNEESIVSWLQQNAGKSRHSQIVLGIGDDCAVYRPKPGEDLVFTTDQLIEGVHFKASMPPAQIGARVLARNLSDLAAMGAEPRFCLVNVAVPVATTEAFLKGFFRGLLKLASETGTTLAGGDLAHSPKMHFDVTACGSVPRGKALRRDGAQAGDAIYVSGPLGKPWTRPIQPRLELGKKLRGRATACIDLSDGLSRDLRRVCLASSLATKQSLCADLDTVPVFRGSTLERALHGGEDYELLFTLSPRRKAPPSCVRIGTVLDGKGSAKKMLSGKAGSVQLNGEPVAPKGYDHFSR